MAKPPLPIDALARTYGPHLNYEPPGGWEESARRPPDRLVKTHCSFCGMQCGIQLKVRDEQVVGFAPWEEFPFNHGMLCPKGVKRYLQGAHPDRLATNLLRTANGFAPIAYDAALDLAARRFAEIQAKYGKDAVAVYGGASMITEKAYVLGKFARVALQTKNTGSDQNGDGNDEPREEESASEKKGPGHAQQDDHAPDDEPAVPAGGRPGLGGGAVLRGDQEQRGEVGEQPRAAHEREHDGADPEDDRVHVEVAAEPGAHTADDASGARAVEAPRLRGLGGKFLGRRLVHGL